MLGVVLWSDSQERKAVIWCEDHGDLAFYHHPENAADGALDVLDAGDLVQFDLTIDRHIRLAANPRLVSEGLAPGLAESLRGATDASSRPRRPDAETGPCAKVVPFQRPEPANADAALLVGRAAR